MAVDLSRLYESLGELADTATVPSVEQIRARGRQRRVRTAGVALSALMVLVVLAGTAAWLIPRMESAVPPDIAPPATFVPFDPSAKPVVASESGFAFDFGYVISRPGRAYAMWLDPDSVQRVVAIDTKAGKPLWEPTSLGRFGDTNGMMVSRDVLLMLTEQRFVNDSDPAGSDRLIAVDPESGKVMWELDYSFNDTDRVLYDDVLVVNWRGQGRVEALDLKTGRPKWTVQEKVIPSGTQAVRTHEEFRLTGSSWLLAGPLPPTDRRVVLQLEDGRAQVRDVGTGQLISERSGVGVQASPDSFAYPVVVDEKIYFADQRGVVEIDLAGGAPARVVFQPSGIVNAPIVPCGRMLLCVLDTRKGGSHSDLVLVDAGSGPGPGRALWRKPVGEAEMPMPIGGAVMIMGDGVSMVVDMTGKQIWSGPESIAGWVDSGNLLFFGREGTAGYNLAGKRTVVLGPEQRFCGWDATHLTCPSERGIFTWRYR